MLSTRAIHRELPSPRSRPADHRPAGFCLSCAALLAISGVLVLSVGTTSDAAAAQPPSPEPAQQLAALLSQQAPRLSYEIYQVRTGDTVENIAARFGVRPAQIRTLNRLPTSTALRLGASLAIPLPRRRRPDQPGHARGQIAQPLPPRYAIVTTASPITSQPADSAAAQLLYQPRPGAQLIVNAEQGDHYGVIMIDGSTGWIAKSALRLTDQTIPPDQLETMLKGGRPDIVQQAFRYLGTPYKYGGRLPDTVDCSLLVRTVFAARGLRLPRTAAAQCEVGHPVSYAELLPGDRLYFISKSGRINHTGIYIGGGRFIHASARRDCVAVDSLFDTIYWTRFAAARRS